MTPFTLYNEALNTALPVVICLIVGCMCEPCKRIGSPQFREPIIGNSMILCRALRELCPSWSLADGQALRSWILSMPALNKRQARLDLLPEEYLRQFCGAPPPLSSVASVRTQTVRLCMPHAPRATLSASAVTEAVSAARPPTPPGAFACAAPAATPVATATTGRPVVQVAPNQLLFTPVLPQWPLTTPEPVFQLLPGPALPVGPVAVLPPLPSGPAPLSALVPIEQDEEDLLLEEVTWDGIFEIVLPQTFLWARFIPYVLLQ